MKNTYITLIEFLLFPILRISDRVANDWSSYPISTEKYLVVFFLFITIIGLAKLSLNYRQIF